MRLVVRPDAIGFGSLDQLAGGQPCLTREEALSDPRREEVTAIFDAVVPNDAELMRRSSTPRAMTPSAPPRATGLEGGDSAGPSGPSPREPGGAQEYRRTAPRSRAPPLPTRCARRPRAGRPSAERAQVNRRPTQPPVALRQRNRPRRAPKPSALGQESQCCPCHRSRVIRATPLRCNFQKETLMTSSSTPANASNTVSGITERAHQTVDRMADKATPALERAPPTSRTRSTRWPTARPAASIGPRRTRE